MCIFPNYRQISGMPQGSEPVFQIFLICNNLKEETKCNTFADDTRRQGRGSEKIAEAPLSFKQCDWEMQFNMDKM